MIDMETVSSMFAFGVLITFGLFIISVLAQNTMMPGFVVVVMLGLFILTRILVK